MTRKLFGTDGVRGVAGELLSAELALGLAQAATRLTKAQRPQVLIVRDTRESGEMLQAAVAAGVAAAGGDALLGGVLPTPAAPLLIARYDFDLAAVLSASHNPFADNGIKFFGPDGYKLSDETELEIERELERAGDGEGADRSGQAPGSGGGGPEQAVSGRTDSGRQPHRPRSGASASCEALARTTCASCTRALPVCTSQTWMFYWTARNGATYGSLPRYSGASERT